MSIEEQKPQPAPQKGGVEVYSLLEQYLKGTDGEDNLYLWKKLEERYNFGKAKYGQGLMTGDKRDGPRDLEEEMLDGIYYLVKCLHNKDNIDNAKMMIQVLSDIIDNAEQKDKPSNKTEDDEELGGLMPCNIL